MTKQSNVVEEIALEDSEHSSWPTLNPGSEAGGFRVEGDLLVTGALMAGKFLGKLGNNSVRTQHLANNAVRSAEIAEADNKTGQNANRGRGVKTRHLQDGAITEAKLDAMLRDKVSRMHTTRAIETLTFADDPDGTTKTIALDFQPQFVLAVSSISSTFGGVFKPHGGLAVGFADLGDEISQFSLGAVVHIVTEGQEVVFQRYSAIGPDSIFSDLGDHHGVALALLQAGTEIKEVFLLKTSAVDGNSVEFQLRRAPVEGEAVSDYRLQTYLVFFGA